MSESEDFDVLVTAVSRLPPKTRLSLLREAAATQDVGWLSAAERNGLFDAPTTPRSEIDHRNHPEEWVNICALASVVDGRSLQTLKADPYSGAEMERSSSIYLSTVAVAPAFLQFFQQVVHNVSMKSLEVLKENLAMAADSRGNRDLHALNVRYGKQATATAGVLMSASAAINDVESISVIDEAFPEAKLTATTALFLPALKGRILVLPLASALAYGHREAVDAILSRDFDVEEPIAYRPGIAFTPSGEALSVQHRNAKDVPLSTPAFWSLIISEGMGLFAPPSVFDRYLDRLFEKAGGVSDQILTDLRDFTRLVCEKDDLKSLLPVLHKHGLFQLDATQLAVDCISKGKLHVLPYVVDDVDWSHWSASEASVAPRSMETFLPILALKANGNTGASLDSEELGSLASFLSRKCVDSGYARVLAVSDQTVNSMRTFVDFDLPDCLLLSLEAGADPHACPNGLPSVKELCEDTGDMEKVLNSFLARKAAEDAVRLIEQDILDEGPKVRP